MKTKKKLTFIHGCLNFRVHSHCRSTVKVTAALESLDHGLAVGHVSQEAELELSVIRNDKGIAWSVRKSKTKEQEERERGGRREEGSSGKEEK
jgi:hypothetical protein